MFTILFGGEYFIPEPDVALRYGRDSPYVFPGRLYNWDGSDLYHKYEHKEGASRHLTFVFNTFVFMQIFNMIASRKIHDEYNIFSGVFTNIMFIALWFVICAGQIAITQFGGVMFVVNKNGLAPIQWGYSIGISLTVLIIDALLKPLPDYLAPRLGQDTVFNKEYPKYAWVAANDDDEEEGSGEKQD